jgi:hypothetical protein
LRRRLPAFPRRARLRTAAARTARRGGWRLALLPAFPRGGWRRARLPAFPRGAWRLEWCGRPFPLRVGVAGVLIVGERPDDPLLLGIGSLLPLVDESIRRRGLAAERIARGRLRVEHAWFVHPRPVVIVAGDVERREGLRSAKRTPGGLVRSLFQLKHLKLEKASVVEEMSAASALRALHEVWNRPSSHKWSLADGAHRSLPPLSGNFNAARRRPGHAVSSLARLCTESRRS